MYLFLLAFLMLFNNACVFSAPEQKTTKKVSRKAINTTQGRVLPSLGRGDLVQFALCRSCDKLHVLTSKDGERYTDTGVRFSKDRAAQVERLAQKEREKENYEQSSSHFVVAASMNNALGRSVDVARCMENYRSDKQSHEASNLNVGSLNIQEKK